MFADTKAFSAFAVDDLGILADQAAEPVPPQHPDVCA